MSRNSDLALQNVRLNHEARGTVCKSCAAAIMYRIRSIQRKPLMRRRNNKGTGKRAGKRVMEDVAAGATRESKHDP